MCYNREMKDCYFRIPNQYNYASSNSAADIARILRKICLIVTADISTARYDNLIPKEDSLQEEKNFTGYSQIYESYHGYKYKCGSGNDWRLDVVDPENNIYLISYRYADPKSKHLQKITAGFCALLDLDYIYDLSFESKIKEFIHPLLTYDNDNDFFKKTRLEIDIAMKELRLFEDDLENEECQLAVIAKIRQKMIQENNHL